MLGNFSFGQYFKEGAIELAWEFMFEQMKLDLDRIWVTVFAGDPELRLGEDEVAVAAWEKIGHAAGADRAAAARRELLVGRRARAVRARLGDVLRLGRGASAAAGRSASPAASCERFLEFWNLVFMEFELHADGTLTPLPKQNIDTGMGLERGRADPPGAWCRSTTRTATRQIMALDRRAVRRRATARATRRRRRTASSPTTGAG